jgi:signal transduction histidine kinase
MRLSSFRTRVLLLAIAFSVFLIGTVLITSYFVVSGGMSQVAEGSAVSLSHQAAKLVQSEADAARMQAANEGLATSPERSRRAQQLFVASLPELLRSGMTEGEFAFYEPTPDGSLAPVWESARGAVVASDAEDRKAALRQQTATVSVHEGGDRLSGLFGKARLGVYAVHMPVQVPNGQQWVLDVVYVPHREEATIDSIRTPMTIHAVFGTALAIAVMQMSMGWVLSLVNDLREAAESIDAGQLDVHLPESGQHEIGDLARTLNHLIDRLRRRAESQTRFIADASHELATPVAGIRGYVNILRAWGGEDTEVREEAIRAIDRESRRMVRLTSELLSMIRSEQDSVTRTVRVDVNAVCREALAGAATRYIEKGLEFVGPEEGQLYVENDPDKIEEFLAILVDNAAKYTPSGGTVSVQTRRRRDAVVVEVSDTGVGIPAEDLPNIFDRFYRSDASRSKQTGGFGLGLAIAKRMVEACGGTIEVQSEIGKGTTFVIRLPRTRAVAKPQKRTA